MRTHKWNRLFFLSFLMLTVLAGCKSSGGTAAPPTISPPAVQAAKPSSTLPQFKGSFDNGGLDYAIASGLVIDIAGQSSDNRVAADYFANDTTGWLLIESDSRKLTLAYTRDGGSTWHNRNIPGGRGEAVFFQDELNGYAMVSASCGTTSGGTERCGETRLLVTHDGGGSWEEGWRSNDKKRGITEADFAKLSGKTGFALTDTGTVLKTMDRGKTWKPLAIGPKDFRAWHMSFLTGLTGWVVGTTETTGTFQVWKTVDGGAHWKRQYERNGNAPGSLGSSGISFFDAKHGYFALGDFDMMRGQLMRTTDGGAHWQAVSDLRPSRPTPMGIRLLSASEGWIPLAMGAGPIEGGLLHFTKGGTNTGTITTGLWDLRDAVPTGNGTGWALAYSRPGSQVTVLKTKDEGKSWKQVWPAPHPTADVVFIDDLRGYGIGRESEPGAFMQTDDGGETWKVAADLGSAGYRLYFTDKKHGWILGTREGGTRPILLETKDGGATWLLKTESLPGWESLPQEMEMKFFNDREGMMIFQTGQELRVLQTRDGGKSWASDTPLSDTNTVKKFTILSPDELLETSLESKKDKTVWLQLSRLALDDGSRQAFGKWNISGDPMGALFPSEKVGAVITPIWKEGKMTVHLLRTLDGGRSWSEGEFPSAVNVDFSMTGRFGSYADSKWWLLVQGHLLRTSDAGEHWRIAY